MVGGIFVHLDAHEVTEFATRLERVGGQVGAKAAAAVRKAAADIERDAKIRAPFEFGTLRNSISTSIEGDGRFGSITAEVGPTVDYGLYQEEGTSKMAPQPYLYPSFMEHVPRLEAALDSIGLPR